MSQVIDFNALLPSEKQQVKLARSMNDVRLRSQLREVASFVHNDFMRAQDLRELAALSLVMARRLDGGELATGLRARDDA